MLGQNKQLGLIGYPLSHSFSKKYFSKKFKVENILGFEYNLYPISAISQLPDLLQNISHLIGLNVTIPYKEAVIPYLDSLNEAAKAVGAVNTIKITNGKSKGYNTDVYGFEQSLIRWRPFSTKTKALVLGTGGAAKAVAYVLKKLAIDFKYVSRKIGEDKLSYADIDKEIIDHHQLIINTTPLGMSPNINNCPSIPYKYLSNQHYLYDLVYNPEKTLFLKKGEAQGAAIKNGWEMLQLQAEKAWSIWKSEE